MQGLALFFFDNLLLASKEGSTLALEPDIPGQVI